jgi:type III secretion protein C
MSKLIARASVFALAAFCITSSYAGDVRWKEEKFTYTAKGKNLKEFLREFGVSQGLSVVVAKDVDGTVNGKFDLLPASLIELMSASFGFLWYAEGNVLYISSANDVRSEVLRLANSNVSRLKQSLDQLDLTSKRYPIIYDARQGTALVSGPSRYVDLVVQTAKSVDQPQTGNSNSQVRVFPLKYAWAGDFTYTQGGRDQTVPGVASVLSQLHNGPLARSQLRLNAGGRSRSAVDILRGLGLGGIGGPGSTGAQRTPGDDAVTAAPQDKLQPQFVADGRLNAVVVRDAPEKMLSHEATIRALDVKPGLVEIEVRIIEINSDALESLGVDWRLKTSRADIQVGKGNLPTLSWATALSDSAPQAGPLGLQALSPSPAGILTTVLGDAGRFLIARVNVLAQEGRANLLSSPKVMTLDNVEAVLENLNTFFVRVAGNLDVNLFDVSVGTSLRVTPLIVEEDGQKQVKLAIRIEDGALTGQSVDNIPLVRRSSITTQSLIGDGQALLIAGYAQESDTNQQAGVPGLSEVPVLGRLFKYTEKKKSKVERFFLLTPKVVAL